MRNHRQVGNAEAIFLIIMIAGIGYAALDTLLAWYF